MWPMHPTDHLGQLIITDEVDEASQGNVVIKAVSGARAGVYLDDSTPHLETWVHAAVAELKPLVTGARQLILVSIPMGRPHFRWPKPVINLLEWYPHNAGWDPGPIPACDGYILQRDYPGYLHETEPKRRLEAPTVAEYERLLAAAIAKRPRYLFDF